MKKFNFKGRKHAVTATCLLVGMFVLTSSAYANYDDARGYTNYKEAVKDLVFNQDNFTADGEMSVLIDGKEMASMKGTLKLDGDDQSTRMIDKDIFGIEENKYESLEVTKDGKQYNYYPESKSYSESEAEADMRPDMSDPTVKKSIRFVELFADTMIGDLKNNFVLESKKGDNRNYSVNVSGSQIPEVVNAGISLMFTAANSEDDSNSSYVNYENHDKAFSAFYEEQTGKKMSGNMYDDWNDEMEKVSDDFYDKYNDVLEAKDNVGIVYVKADGTYEYYKTYDEYLKNIEPNAFDERDIMTMLGTDPYIDNAMCNFTLDKEGKLISNEMEASMVGTDSKGKKHTITMKVNFKGSDYGTTKVEAFDTTGKTKMTY